MAGEDVNHNSPPVSLTEVFEKVFPYYLMAGMTYDQFFRQDPRLAKYYREKMDLLDHRANEEAWVIGRYNFIAVSTALSNAFRKKGVQAIDYPKQPFKLQDELEAEAEAKRKKAYEDSIAFIKNLERRRIRKNGDT